MKTSSYKYGLSTFFPFTCEISFGLRGLVIWHTVILQEVTSSILVKRENRLFSASLGPFVLAPSAIDV